MFRNVILGGFLLISLFSCATKAEKRGYMFDLVDYNLLEEGVTSKERVLKIMGFPTIISSFQDQTWIYYSENKEGFLFFKPSVVSREILVLKFDESDILKNVKKLGLSDESKNLVFASEYTEVESRKTGILKSIFSNIGQVKSQ